MRKSNAAQAPLFARSPKRAESAPQRERRAEANALAARVILADPLRHGGPWLAHGRVGEGVRAERGGRPVRGFERARFDARGGSYPGGKSGSGVYQQIINLMPPHDVYIEPFLGGGAVLRRKRPAALNIGIDLDSDVITRWRTPREFSAAPTELPASADAANSGDSRRRAPRSPASPVLSALPGCAPGPASETPGTISASRAADSGGMRSRAPLSRDSGSRAASHGVTDYSAWQFLCEDGIAFLGRYPYTGRELVYCDPPYLHGTRRDLALYQHELSADRHVELLDLLRRLPCRVLISGYYSSLYARALEGWNLHTFTAMTRRGPATEHCWYNYAEPVELHDYRFLGANRRERERIKLKCERWTAKLARMDTLERRALLAALATSTSAEDSVGRTRCGD